MRALVLVAAALLCLAPLLPPLAGALPAASDNAALVSQLAAEAGVPNTVSGVILHVRLFDTIGEVVVFTLTSLGVGWMLRGERVQGPIRGLDDPVAIELCRLGATLATLVAVELALRGHMSPGGGFAAGVAGGTALGLGLLSGLGRQSEALHHRWRVPLLEKTAVLAFIAIALLSLLGLPLPEGTFGTTGSGGWIPPLNVLMALKVTLGSWSMLQLFVRYRGWP